jgi:type I restriction enzyme M protein
MLTGDLKSKIDQIWNAFWSGGIANPIEVIEQITYLLFLRRLDDLHTLEENKANRLKKPMERRIFPEGPHRAALAQLDGPFASLQQRAFAGALY